MLGLFSINSMKVCTEVRMMLPPRLAMRSRADNHSDHVDAHEPDVPSPRNQAVSDAEEQA